MLDVSSKTLRSAVHTGAIALLVAAIWALGAPPAPASPSADFNTYLAEGYLQMAELVARTAGDRQMVDFYRQRDALAAKGRLVSPQEVGLGRLDSWTLREAGFARKELVATLDGGARRRQPLLAAIAQVNFDCWVMPLAHQPGVPDGDECRRRFYFAYAGLVRSRPPASSPPLETVRLVRQPSEAADPPPSPTPQTAVLVRQLPDPPPADSDPASCGPHCLVLAFVGPAADSLIHALREGASSGGPGDGASDAGLASGGRGLADSGFNGAGAFGSGNGNGNGNPSGSGASGSGGGSGSGNGSSDGSGGVAAGGGTGNTDGGGGSANGSGSGSGNSDGSGGSSDGSGSGSGGGNGNGNGNGNGGNGNGNGNGNGGNGNGKGGGHGKGHGSG